MKRTVFLFAFFSNIYLLAEMFFTPEMICSHLKEYSDEEILQINKDLDVVRSVCLANRENTESRFFLATAGAPGARKTTILEKFVSTHQEYQGGAYLDPDPRTLKFMVHTYYAQSLTPVAISESNNYDQTIQKAYEKWRAGSNYIVLSLLEEAFEKGRSIVYGTTATGAHMPAFFTKLKKNDYKIVLLLCSCPDALRYEAVNYRNRVVRFYQSSPEDAVAKGTLFPQRMETYFSYADQLYFYWSDDLFSPERLAGIWVQGKLEIHDRDAMDLFIDKYETDRMALKERGISIPSFNSLLSKE